MSIADMDMEEDAGVSNFSFFLMLTSWAGGPVIDAPFRRGVSYCLAPLLTTAKSYVMVSIQKEDSNESDRITRGEF